MDFCTHSSNLGCKFMAMLLHALSRPSSHEFSILSTYSSYPFSSISLLVIPIFKISMSPVDSITPHHSLRLISFTSSLSLPISLSIPPPISPFSNKQTTHQPINIAQPHYIFVPNWCPFPCHFLRNALSSSLRCSFDSGIDSNLRLPSISLSLAYRKCGVVNSFEFIVFSFTWLQ